MFAVLFFVYLSENSLARESVALGAYWVAAALALFAIFTVLLKTGSNSRTFWALLGGGLIFRFAGDMSREGFPLFDLLTPIFGPNDVVYGASYLLFGCALTWLVYETTSRITIVAALDSLCVVLSSGVLVWHFSLGPAAAEAGLDSLREALGVLAGPVLDVGLLCLGLVVLQTRHRPPFARLLVGGLVVFLVADGIYLGMRSAGPHEAAAWPELVWALGIALFGLAALEARVSTTFVRQIRVDSWTLFAFWFGPLSPAMHYAFLLVWGAFHQPLPSYVMWTGGVILLYLAFRISIASSVSRKLRRDAEMAATKSEQSRISEELHDSLKQSVYGTSLLLDAYKEARDNGAYDNAEDILAKATKAAREANYHVSRPIGELRALCEHTASKPEDRLKALLNDVERSFGTDSHEDLRADLGKLSPEELATVHRVVGEALWNAVKHSGADNVWLESRQVDSLILVKVRDDGRGFSPEEPPAESGIAIMRARTEQVGGELDIVSKPGGGTSVQVRFGRR